LGNTFAKTGDYKTAITYYDQIIEIDNLLSDAYLNRGLVKELQGDLDGACNDWKKAETLGNKDAPKYTKECK
jgi:tetratricopeptide (TPR) repeat protein